MKLEKLIRGVNKNINSVYAKGLAPEDQAHQIIKGILNSAQSEDIFGTIFNATPYRYTKKMIPNCQISKTCTGIYISGLQFIVRDIDLDKININKIKRINEILSRLDYNSLRVDNFVDLTTIHNLTFKI
jgi:hypothetical protein